MSCMYIVFASRFAQSGQGYCVLECLTRLLAVGGRFSQCHETYRKSEDSTSRK